MVDMNAVHFTDPLFQPHYSARSALFMARVLLIAWSAPTGHYYNTRWWTISSQVMAEFEEQQIQPLLCRSAALA